MIHAVRAAGRVLSLVVLFFSATAGPLTLTKCRRPNTPTLLVWCGLAQAEISTATGFEISKTGFGACYTLIDHLNHDNAHEHYVVAPDIERSTDATEAWFTAAIAVMAISDIAALLHLSLIHI